MNAAREAAFFFSVAAGTVSVFPKPDARDTMRRE